MKIIRVTLFALTAISLFVGFIISGCAISNKTYLPDGSEGYSISCDGSAVGINVCFEKAGQICGSRGYDIINREGQIVPFGVGSANSNQAFITYGSFNTKSIMIRCKEYFFNYHCDDSIPCPHVNDNSGHPENRIKKMTYQAFNFTCSKIEYEFSNFIQFSNI